MCDWKPPEASRALAATGAQSTAAAAVTTTTEQSLFIVELWRNPSDP
jgi:hypothetical protein